MRINRVDIIDLKKYQIYANSYCFMHVYNSNRYTWCRFSFIEDIMKNIKRNKL